VVKTIDLDAHSTATAEEFRKKHGLEVTVEKMIGVMSKFL